MFVGNFKKQEFGKYMKEFAGVKYKAFKLGKSRDTVTALRDLIKFTDYTSGDLAEIVMAYMLGYFCSICPNLYVGMTADLDKCGIDF